MASSRSAFLLKYGIPSIAVVVIIIQVYFVNTHNLSKWKGGGYGMYTEIHYFYNQIYIPGMSVDSLLKDDPNMKSTLGYLMLMPNKDNLNEAAKLVLRTTKKDSIHIQIWKPTINSENGVHSRALIDEVYMKTSNL
ncbi:hypothetical protein [Winogradskyella thalassocola]|uniref:Uncharacterized protein n=1 Tax=Winogradskyella thalassocola TaxID=262004 RepID=A0A1G8ITZ7_9FLAO|nr:hypothetical protein [Winogradskyella thalassocola]SDI22292.1 hypothetical protein SAMN04489796_10876 [Winogradskyella thalassocola]